MVGAIKEITVNQGVDPREALIVGGGGAAGLNIVPIARRLGCRQVLVPRTAGALSACGGQYSNIVAEFSLSKFAFSGDFAYEEVNRTLEKIQGSVNEFSNALRHKGLQRFATEFFVEARYAYQVWELDVRLAKGRFDGPADLEAMIEAFHREHERVFAVKEPGQNIECLYWKGRLTAFLESPPLVKLPATSGEGPSPRRHCEAFFSGVGAVRTPRYLGAALEPGARIEGPAIIDEPTTTIVIYPQAAVRVTELRNYLADVA
jgi:N-methylhydantoinase A